MLLYNKDKEGLAARDTLMFDHRQAGMGEGYRVPGDMICGRRSL